MIGHENILRSYTVVHVTRSLHSSVAVTLRGFTVYAPASQLAVFSAAVAHLVSR
jgi:hypothetical protein